jgi:phage terminase large subunit
LEITALTSEYTYKPSKALFKVGRLVKGNDLSIIQGGQGAGKTIAILMLLTDLCIRQVKEVTVCSSELSKLKGTAINDFIKIVKDYGIYSQDRWNKSEMIFRFENASFIEFIGLDKVDVGKGRRRDYVFINETNKVNLQSFTDITARAKKVICDFNPDAHFYLHELADASNFISLTYKDNQYLPEKEVLNILRYKERGYHEDGTIKSKYWANKWRVYGLGEIGSLDGVIFQNYDIESFGQIGTLIGYGLDFGFSNDPTALIEMRQADSKLYCRELIYETGLTNSDIANRMTSLGVSKGALIVADSAEPKSIEEIRRMGFTIDGVKKGADSINFGINLMQQQEYKIHANSRNLIKELSSYSWKIDRNGNTLNIPIDDYNHALDALRYLTTYKFSKKGYGTYTVL